MVVDCFILIVLLCCYYDRCGGFVLLFGICAILSL